MHEGITSTNKALIMTNKVYIFQKLRIKIKFFISFSNKLSLAYPIE